MLSEVLLLTNRITGNVIHDLPQKDIDGKVVFAMLNGSHSQSTPASEKRLAVKPVAKTPQDLMKSNVHVVDAAYNESFQTKRKSEVSHGFDDDVVTKPPFRSNENIIVPKLTKTETRDTETHHEEQMVSKFPLYENEIIVEREDKCASDFNIIGDLKSQHNLLQMETALEQKMREYADIIEKKYLSNQVKSQLEEEEIQKKLDIIMRELDTLKNVASQNINHNCTAMKPKEVTSVDEHAKKTNSRHQLLHDSTQKKVSRRKEITLNNVLQTPIPRKSVPRPIIHMKQSITRKSPSKPRLSEKGFALLKELIKDSPTKASRQLSSQFNKSEYTQSNKSAYTQSNKSAYTSRKNTNEENVKKDHLVSQEKLSTKIQNLHSGLQNMLQETSSLKNKLTDNHEKETPVGYQHVIKAGHYMKERPGDDDDVRVYDFTRENEQNKHLAGKREIVSNNIDLLKSERISGFLLDHSLSEKCPIDKYLNKPKDGRTDIITPQVRNDDHVIFNVKNVLKELDKNRKQLETNMEELQRQRNQADGFHQSRNEETGRLKKLVDEKIQGIQTQIDEELKENLLAVKVVTQTSKRIPLHLRNYLRASEHSKKKTVVASDNISSHTGPANKLNGKVNNARKIKVKKQQKPASSVPPKSSMVYDDLVFKHLYGNRQPYHAQRHTIKEHIPTFNTETIHHDTRQLNTSIQNQQLRPVFRESNPSKPDKFFFHPNNQIIDGMSGNMIPIAIPLAEPCTDPSKRLPLTTQKDQECIHENKEKRPMKVLSRAGPNVAVIDVKADDLSDISTSSEMKERLRSKVRERVKRKMKLCKQPLPNMDIDTTDPSSTSIADETPYPVTIAADKSLQTSFHGKSVKHTDHMTSINPEEYKFQDFIYIKETAIQNEQDHSVESISDNDEKDFENDLVEIHGSKEKDSLPFQPPPTPRKTDVENIRKITVPNIQDIAHEWLEQELLAKLISLMKEKTDDVDPTMQLNFPTHVVHTSFESNDGDWIEQFLGSQGMQFFIDAGIPLDKDIITHLTREVIIEILESMFGYPKPLTEENLPKQNISEEEEPEPIRLITTPVQTPEHSHSQPPVLTTPERSVSDLDEQTLDEFTRDASKINSTIASPRETSMNVRVETPENSNLGLSEDNDDKIATPEVSMVSAKRNEESIGRNIDVETPEHTLKDDIEVLPIDDFIPTETTPNSSPTNDEVMHKEDLDVTPQITPVTKIDQKLTSSRTDSYSMSTSTAVGLSTFEGISVGEHLHPSQALSDYNGSEGEFNNIVLPPLNEALEQDEVINQDLSRNDNFEMKLMKVISKRTRDTTRDTTRSTILVKSEGEINAPINGSKSDGEFFTPHFLVDEDTFDILSSKDEKLLRDPVFKVLRKTVLKEHSDGEISPHSGAGTTQRSRGETTPFSRGEILSQINTGEATSTGEDDHEPIVLQNKETEDRFSKLRPRLINVVPTHANNTSVIRHDGFYHLPSTELENRDDDKTLSSVEEIDDITGGVPLTSRIEDDESSKGKIDIVLRMPTVDQDFTDDDISQYELSNVSGGEI